MRWVLLVGVLTAIAGALVFFFGFKTQTPWGSFNIRPNVTACYGGPEVPAADRAALEAAALSFTRTLMGATPEEAYALMSSRGQAEATAEGVADAARQLRGASRGAFTVERVYLLSGVGGDRWAPCAGADGQDFVRAGGSASPGAAGTVREGHVLITDTIDGGARTFSLWLVFENGAWRVAGFQSDISELMGRSGGDLWRLAREEKRVGHHLNAFVLFKGAQSLVRRGGYVQLSSAREMEEAANDYLAPEEAREDPWEIGGVPFDVQRVSYNVSLGDRKTSLVVDYTIPNWTEDAVAERQNRQLLDALMRAYPEWESIFDAVVARASAEGRNTTWGTVFIKGRGYSADAEPAP